MDMMISLACCLFSYFQAITTPVHEGVPGDSALFLFSISTVPVFLAPPSLSSKHSGTLADQSIKMTRNGKTVYNCI
jgi:hypothetical protein